MLRIITLMFALVLSTQIWAQQKTLTGTITDEKGLPVSAASISVKGTQLGTSTDVDGKFSITVPATAKTLIVTAIGFKETELAIGARTVVNATITSSTDDLDEVVVVAYGTVKKSDFIGSMGTVSAAEIEKRPVANISRALEGNVPGVIVTSGSGQPGSGSSVRIRGFGSINATQDPLYVVDGVPYVGGLSNLNPDDIASLTVLKDANATALYGSRAGNGVVLITTKKGVKGKNSISLKVQQGISARGIAEYDRVNQFEYYPLMWEAYRNSLAYRANNPLSLDSASRIASGLTNFDGIDDILAYNPFNVPRNAIVGVNGQINPNAQLLYADDQDWTDFFMGNGYRQEYNLSLNGGADKTDYYLSMGYLSEDGFTRNTDFERFSVRANLNMAPLKWFKTGLNISGNATKSNQSNTGGAIANPFQFSRNLGPIYPYWAHNMTTGAYVLDENGNRIWDLGNFQNEQIGIDNGIRNRPGTTAGRHAPAELELNIDRFRRMVASIRQYSEITFMPGLKFTANFAFDYNNQFDEGYENQLVGDGAPAGRADKVHNINQALTANQLLNYNKSFGVHTLDFLVGHESYDQQINDMRGFRQGQSLTGNIEFGNFTTINTLTSVTDRYRTESVFGRVNYDFDSKYYLSGSLRRDGNSRFAPVTRWGTFGSVGAGVALDKLPAFAGISWINQLKLRGSYGTVGVADGIGFYAWQGLYGFANNANEPGIVQGQTSFENLNLKWEVNKQADLGLDFALFNRRLSGSFEWYNRTSQDLLFAVPTPLSSGALSITQNTASLYNRGVELALNFGIVAQKNFGWNMGLQFTTVRNQITKMPESIPEFITGTKKYEVGASLFDYWVRSYYGIDPDDGAVLYLAENTQAPDVRLKTNKDGGVDTVTNSINNGRFAFQGGVIPDFYGSMSQEFRYKNFTLSALFTFQSGGLTFDGAYQTLMSAGTYGNAVHKDILNRWQRPGDITNVPRMDNGQTQNFNATSSRWLIDASYFNIRTITLNYALPKRFLNKYNIASASVFLSGENVAFFSKRKGMNNQNAFSGITSSNYPPARIISGGFSIKI